jgi:hypothetical protein
MIATSMSIFKALVATVAVTTVAVVAAVPVINHGVVIHVKLLFFLHVTFPRLRLYNHLFHHQQQELLIYNATVLAQNRLHRVEF